MKTWALASLTSPGQLDVVLEVVGVPQLEYRPGFLFSGAVAVWVYMVFQNCTDGERLISACAQTGNGTGLGTRLV